MKIKKYSGELVDFDINRLKGSLLKSGASEEIVATVWEKMNTTLFDGISTKQIYKLAFQLLKEERNSLAARYSLKKALRDLGPTGYLFEKWIGRLFEHIGYKTQTSLMLAGRAVNHEVDVIAQKEGEMLLIECKFRNTVDAKVDVTNPMYFLSRFIDLKDKSFAFFNKEVKFTEPWLVTNAYLTKDAISFGNCYNIRLLSWDYPLESSIKRRVDSMGLYPLTCLTTINKLEKDRLLSSGNILVKDILKKSNALERLGATSQRLEKIYQEADELINGV